MKIDLHIERLILDGLPAHNTQGPHLGAAIQAELTRSLESHGLSPELRSGIALPHIQGGQFQLGNHPQPATVGRKIAQAVHQGIGHPGNKGPQR
jgi:hypothetical protein